LACGFDGTARKTGQLCLVCDNQLERIGRIEHIFGIFRRNLRQFDVDFGQSLFAFRI